MKKIITSAGCLALGVAGLNAAYVFPGTGRLDTSKFWSASVSLRGFYDDNPTTVPDRLAEDSFGFEVRPTLSLNLYPQGQTYLGLTYTYSMRYYFDRDDNRADHSHDVIAKFDHAFNERYRIEVSDWFTLGQEPQLLDTIGGVTVPIRTKGDNIRNRVSADLYGEMTERVGFGLGYANTVYDYEQNGVGSRSAILDRVEHLGHLDLRFRATPELVALVGYQFGYNDYSGKAAMYFFGPTSEVRNNYSHYGYAGIDYKMTSKLTAAVRAGAQYTDYTDAPSSTDNEWNPYADLSLTYTYLPESWVQFGLRHSRLATDIVSPDAAGNPTIDQEATTVYATVNHKITSRLTGNVIGQYQMGTFNDGSADDKEDNIYMVGVYLDFSINKNWGLEAGYNYDKLDSDLGGRSYSRNRVFIGIRATY